MAPIPRELIARARKGNVKCLNQVADLLNSSNYSLVALDAALTHLSLDALPNSGSSRALQNSRLESAHAAIPIVAMSVDRCQRSDALRKATISRILDEIDGLLAWLHLLILSALFMGSLLELGIVSSRRTVDLLILMWSKEHGEYTQDDASFMAVSTAQFVEKFVRNPDGLNLLCDTLRASPSFAKQLYAGLETRFLKIPELSGKSISIEDTKKLLALTGIIAIHLAQEPAMDARFRRSGCLRHFLDAILSVKQSLTHLDVLYLSNAILRLASRPGAQSPASEMGEIAKSPLIPILAECFSTPVVEWDPEAVTSARQVIESLRTYCYFLKVFVPLTSALDQHSKIHPLSNAVPTGTNAEVYRGWQLLVTSVHRLDMSIPHDEMIEETGRMSPRICDNETHWELRPDDTPWVWEWTSKGCSGCHWTRYCSSECQRDDWHRRHRQQCRLLRCAQEQRRAFGIHYSTSTRSVHQELILALFEDEWSAREADIRTRGLSSSVKDYILVFNGFWGLVPQSFEVVPWSQWERIQGDCPLSESEVTRTIEKWRATRETNTRLVEAIFQYNPDTRISLLMEFAVAKVRVLRNIVRIESRE
ncbi:hypothetical protein BKA70DRAFT_1567867 [Coprinopsis sp. MPI-PUGE-AT-0042]|nr:hypothetical protein BKA70DRAFT_1567867 [Coprinopsis sp. MPI-PUGE-AT-0042]